MPTVIAINGTRLDQVRMPLVPYSKDVVSSLSYPKSRIHFARDDNGLRLVIPPYLAVELYRLGTLPQDAKTPVKIAIGGRSAGHFVVSDVRYPQNSDSPFGEVIFTLTSVPEGTTRAPGRIAPRLPRIARVEAEVLVTDITHYLDETGELAQMPTPARNLAGFLTLLIEAATGAVPAGEHDSGIRCRATDCRGTIRTFLPPSGEEISWHCPVCRHNGVIRNWHNTKWNQLKRSEG